MHDDCSDRDVSQDGDVTGPNRNEAPEKDKVVLVATGEFIPKRLQCERSVSMGLQMRRRRTLE